MRIHLLARQADPDGKVVELRRGAGREIMLGYGMREVAQVTLPERTSFRMTLTDGSAGAWSRSPRWRPAQKKRRSGGNAWSLAAAAWCSLDLGQW